LIREAKTHQISSIIQTSQKFGMQNMDQTLKTLVMNGKIDGKEAKMYASNAESFDEHIPVIKPELGAVKRELMREGERGRT
jgi:twitching motility protein PilT